MSADKAKTKKEKKGEEKAKGKGKGKGASGIAGERPVLPGDYIPRLLTHYQEKVVPALKQKFEYGNIMMVPRLVKIVVNAGVGEASQNPRVIEGVVKELAALSGQTPTVAKARRSVSNFKLRQGMPIGVFVTMRRQQMWEFFDRFNSIVAPRIRDFRGLPDRGFDGRGNYSVGLKEQIVFPEIDLDTVEKIRGLDITFVTTAKTDREAYELLKELGLPFRKREANVQTAEAA